MQVGGQSGYQMMPATNQQQAPVQRTNQIASNRQMVIQPGQPAQTGRIINAV